MSTTKSLLIQIFAHDEPGLVSVLSGTLYDLGLNLGDTTFAVLGTGAEFSVVVEEPVPVGMDEIRERLAELPELAGADITVEEFPVEAIHGPSAQITHRIVMHGADQPGLVARLSEVFVDYGANIVRMNAERGVDKGRPHYIVRFSAWVPEDRAEAFIAALTNTASQMRMFSQWHRE